MHSFYILGILTLAVMVLSLTQSSRHKRATALCVAGPFTAAYAIDFLSLVPDDYYYLMVASAECLSIILLANSAIIDRLTMRLIDVCTLFFVAQIIGCIVYFCDLPPTTYNFLCLALYFVLMATLIRKDAARDGTYNSYSGDSTGLWASIRPSRLLIPFRKKEIRA